MNKHTKNKYTHTHTKLKAKQKPNRLVNDMEAEGCPKDIWEALSTESLGVWGEETKPWRLLDKERK